MQSKQYKFCFNLLKVYEKYSPDLLDVIEFIIIDDKSPLRYKIPKIDLNLRWIKINENIKQKQVGAINQR